MDERQDSRPIGELLDALSPANRSTLAAAGFGMERLRELAATEPGERQVRHIITEFGAEPGRRAALRRFWRSVRSGGAAVPDRPGVVARHWALILLTAGAGLAAVVAADVLVARPLGFVVAALAWTGLLLLVLTGPDTRRRDGLSALAVVAATVLMATAVLAAPSWYLAVRGRQAQAALAAPEHSWAHGSRVTYCRVRLPDGRVRRVDHNDSTCARAGHARVAVVYDPDDRVAPVLGRASGLGTVSGPVAGGAGGLLVAAAAAAVAGAARRREV